MIIPSSKSSASFASHSDWVLAPYVASTNALTACIFSSHPDPLSDKAGFAIGRLTCRPSRPDKWTCTPVGRMCTQGCPLPSQQCSGGTPAPQAHAVVVYSFKLSTRKNNLNLSTTRNSKAETLRMRATRSCARANQDADLLFRKLTSGTHSTTHVLEARQQTKSSETIGLSRKVEV